MSDDTNDREQPEATTDDTVADGGHRHSPIAESPSGRLLADLVEAMHGAGDSAEDEYQDALGRVRERPDEVLVEIARALGDCSENDHPLRWSLIYAAGELVSVAALPLLKTVVMTPIPPERSNDTHSYSTVAEETALRTTAVEGIAELAKLGDEEAIDALFEIIELNSISIQRAGVQGLLSTPVADDLRDRIVGCLPKDRQFLLDLKRVDVTDVPQIEDPTVHLSQAGRQTDKTQPPRFDDRSDDRPERQRPTAD